MIVTGDRVKIRPPPLWKSCILTIVPLFIVVWQVGGALEPYLLPTGMPFNAIAFIKLSINLVINSYIGLPLMMSQFGEWLHMPRTSYSWPYIRFLDKGLVWQFKYILVICYITANLLAGRLA